jgi:hypothetical protein
VRWRGRRLDRGWQEGNGRGRRGWSHRGQREVGRRGGEGIEEELMGWGGGEGTEEEESH